MTGSPGTPDGVLLYDGDCGFCQRSVNAVIRVARPSAESLPWQQSDLAALGLTPRDCDVAVQWVRPGQGVSASGAFALRAFIDTGRPWTALSARVLVNRVTRPIVDRVYALVAARRHRLTRSGCALSGTTR